MTSRRRWAPARLLADIRPLRESAAFRRLWIGSSLSSVGGRMTAFALMLQIYELTHSSAAVGALWLVQAIPAVTLGLLGGSIADAVDRRRLVLVTRTCLALVSVALAVQAYADLGQLWLLYALAAVQAVLQAIDNPAQRTFVPHLLTTGQIPAGMALNMLSFHLSLLAGPTLAGFITAAAGLKVCYLIDGVSFLAALYGVARLPPVPPQPDARRPGLHAMAEGLRFIRRQRVLMGAFLTDINATFFGMPVALFPALNAAHFGGRPQSLGLLTAALGVGGLLGSALSGPVGRVGRQGRAMLIAAGCWGAGIAGFGLARVLWLAVAMLAVAGAADVTSVVFRTSIVQTVTPDRLRGRVSAADYVVGAGVPKLGNFEAGALGSLTSPVISAVSGGVATVVAAAVLALALPSFRRYRARATGAEPESGLLQTSATAPESPG
jgi:MFS family permease